MFARSLAAAAVIALASASTVRAQGGFSAIWGSGPNEIWVAGNQGHVAHFNGQGWVAMRSTTNPGVRVRAVWAASPTDVWVVGDDGLILHLSGGAWQYVRAPVRHDFVAVGGCAANDVWVVGQSDDESRPPALLHYNGQAWTSERAPVPFRPAGIGITCPGGITLAGATWFDPRPDQRRSAGVLMRRTGASWTLRGYDGRAINDVQLGGASWTGIASCGSATLLHGEGNGGHIILRGSGGAWTPVPMPSPPDAHERSIRFAIGCDGTPLFVYDKGFGRFRNGQWAIQSAGGRVNTSTMEGNSMQMQALMMRIQQYASRGQQPPKPLMDSMIAAQAAMQQTVSGITSASARMQSLAFGDEAAVYAPSAAAFYVATGQGKVFRVRGDTSEVVWDAMCADVNNVDPCTHNAARGGALPAPAQGAPPVARDDDGSGNAPTPAAPAANPGKRLLPNRPSGLPRRP